MVTVEQLQSVPCRADRPPSYHRRGERDTYLLALRRLHARGWSDREIAETLSDLSEADILLIEKHKLWNRDDVEGAQRPDPTARRWEWTRRQVRYYRRQLGLIGRRGKRQQHECGSLGGQRWADVRARAANLGWGHLLPLTPAQVQLLEALADAPGARAELEKRTGLILDSSRLIRGAAGRQRNPLRALLDRQIVAIVRLQPVPVYGLAEGIARHVRTPFKTSLERLAESMNWNRHE